MVRRKVCKMMGLICALAVCTSTIAPSGMVKAEDSDVEINEEMFPDESFREYVLKNIDKDNDCVLSTDEITSTKTIDVKNCWISDLTGIELFTALKELDCSDNQLTDLDLSGNKALVKLDCVDNKLSRLDLSENVALKELICIDSESDGELNTMDLSENSELKTIYVTGQKKLTEMDLTANTKLIELHCSENNLKSLNLKKNTSLKTLDCSGNRLTSLSLESNKKLSRVWCDFNKLTSLDLSGNPALTLLNCSNNRLSSIILNNNPKLDTLSCNNNKLKKLDISGNPKLNVLACHFNPMTGLNIGNNPLLLALYKKGVCQDYEDNVLHYDYDYKQNGLIDDEGSLELDSKVKITTVSNPNNGLTGWKTIKGKKYYYKNGKKLTGWKKINNKKYYFSKKGVMQTGWKKISNKWYYFSLDGVMKTGWKKISGKRYYFGSDGVMKTGWKKISGKWYYFAGSGIMQTGWKMIGKKWYFFAKSGVMQVGWQTISGKDYFFSKEGYMLVGTYKLSGEIYKFNSNGVRISGEKSYCFYKSLMDDIRVAIKRNDYSYGFTSDGSKVKYKHLSETLRKKWGGGRYGAKYAFADLNADGIKEMIVYDDGKVASIYTYYNGKTKLLREFDSDSPGCVREYVGGWEYHVYLTKKGEIVFNYAYVPQGIDVGVVVCRVKDGKLILVSGYSEGEGYGYYPVIKMASPQVQVDYRRTISQREVNAIKRKKSENGLSVTKHSF